jgi:hypothetical protein
LYCAIPPVPPKASVTNARIRKEAAIAAQAAAT